jgi:hypothetical protein
MYLISHIHRTLELNDLKGLENFELKTRANDLNIKKTFLRLK